jgi:PPOX class probable F420-dependent enzyme
MLDVVVRSIATASPPNFATLTTLLGDGTPQTHVMWIDADDEHLLINTEVHRRKFKNLLHDPRATVMIWDREDPYRFAEARGRMVEHVTGPSALAHIEHCAMRYLGRAYPSPITSERVIVRIAVDHVHLNGIERAATVGSTDPDEQKEHP